MGVLPSSRMTFFSVLFAKLDTRLADDLKIFQRPSIIEWALASMIAAGGTAKMGLANPEEMASGIEACKWQKLLGPEAPSQACLSIREGGGLAL